MRVAQIGRLRHWLVFLILASGLPGCKCVLKEPLSNPNEAKGDKQLFGAWKIDLPGKEPKDYDMIVIGNADLRGAPAGLLKLVNVSNNGEEKINIGINFFFTTFLGTENYANFLDQDFLEKGSPQTWEKAKEKNWYLLKYSVVNDRLNIWHMDDQALDEAITKKELKGTVEEKGDLKIKSITITDSKHLLRFLSNGGDKKIFTDKTKHVFSRIK
jgi:hypothetical protein